jgi:hypothetical protein
VQSEGKAVAISLLSAEGLLVGLGTRLKQGVLHRPQLQTWQMLVK